jgi:hydrogenase expression/formation protein HypC
MCIAIPMQVTQAGPGRAWVHGRGQRQRIDTALVGDCAPGEWLLVFLGSARERIDAARAAEIDSLLDLVEGAAAQPAEPGFALPSAMSAGQMAALTSSTS